MTWIPNLAFFAFVAYLATLFWLDVREPRATTRKIVWAKLDDWHRADYVGANNVAPYVAFDIAYECNLPVDVVVPHVRTWLRSRGLE